MGMPRTCPNCFAEDGLHFSFGDFVSEISHHNTKWCKCGYETPDQMMEDLRKNFKIQFKDPNWVRIAREQLKLNNKKLDALTKRKISVFLNNLYSSSKRSDLNISLISKTLSDKIKISTNKKQVYESIQRLKDQGKFSEQQLVSYFNRRFSDISVKELGEMYNGKVPEDLTDSKIASNKITTKKDDSYKHIKRKNHTMKYLIKVSKYKVLLSFIIGFIIFLFASIHFAKTNYFELGSNNPLSKSYCVSYGKLANYCYTKSVNNYPKGALYGLIIGTSFFFLISFSKKPNNR
jgi:hypothetical protein